MLCQEVQDTIIESFETEITEDHRQRVERHLSTCHECTRFASLQREIDSRMQAIFPAPALSPEFSRSLRQRIRRKRREEVAASLPDVAYVIGAVVAILLCAVLLPIPPSIVLPAGTFIALVAYALESILLGLFNERDWLISDERRSVQRLRT